jgi:hypothetical protein
VDGEDIIVLVVDLVNFRMDESSLVDEVAATKVDLDRPEDPDPEVDLGIDPDLDGLFPRGIESGAKSRALLVEA